MGDQSRQHLYKPMSPKWTYFEYYDGSERGHLICIHEYDLLYMNCDYVNKGY